MHPMPVFNYLLCKVIRGSRFNIDLKRKNLQIDKQWVVKEGELVDNKHCVGFVEAFKFNTTPWDMVKELYLAYADSVPSEKHYGNPPYFKAKDLDELDDAHLAMGEFRDFAQAYLEGYVLCMSLVKLLKWEWEDNWFVDLGDGCIVLREWIE